MRPNLRILTTEPQKRSRFNALVITEDFALVAFVYSDNPDALATMRDMVVAYNELPERDPRDEPNPAHGERGHRCSDPIAAVCPDRLCEAMRGRVLPVSHRVQRNEGRKTCVACGEALA